MVHETTAAAKQFRELRHHAVYRLLQVKPRIVLLKSIATTRVKSILGVALAVAHAASDAWQLPVKIDMPAVCQVSSSSLPLDKPPPELASQSTLHAHYRLKFSLFGALDKLYPGSHVKLRSVKTMQNTLPASVAGYMLP